MKTFLILLFTILNLTLAAQYSVLRIIVHPNKARVIQIDDKDYPADNLYRSSKSNEYTITDLQPGQHTIKIVSARGDISEISFTLSSNYNMTIEVARKGTISISEQRNVEYETDPRIDMNNKDFLVLTQTLQGLEFNSQRELAVTEFFLNRGFHFSSSQIIELLQLLSGDSTKLKLAKLSYGSLIDPRTFDKIILVFGNVEDKKDLQRFMESKKSLLKVKVINMSQSDFNRLKNLIDTEWLVVEKDKAIMNAFRKKGNHFTTQQARELIEMSGTEDARKLLAIASFSSVTDQENFTSILSLFGSQASKNDIAFYIFNTKSDKQSRQPNFVMPIMSSTEFSIVIDGIYYANEDKRTQLLVNRFASPYSSFSATQIGELIQMIKDESNRLLLLKASYRVITNQDEFISLYDLLWTKASREALAVYQSTYFGH